MVYSGGAKPAGRPAVTAELKTLHTHIKIRILPVETRGTQLVGTQHQYLALSTNT
jgi:hypothetical protein